MNESRDFWLTVALLSLAMLVGGAGMSFPILELLLIWGGVCLAAYLLLTRRIDTSDRVTKAAVAVVGATLLLPLIQLLPLPPEVWQSLPGRTVPQQLDQLLGWRIWRPISLDSEATVRSFLTALPAAALFLAAVSLPTHQRLRLLWVVAGFALFGAALSILQVASGGRLTPYPSAHLGSGLGLFVNRNHNAALLLAAMPLSAAFGAMRIATHGGRVAHLIATLCALALLSVGALSTTSRTALVLLPFAIALSLFLLFYRRSPWRIALPSLLAVGALITVIFVGGGFDETIARFSPAEDARFSYWRDIQWALGHYGLAGTGFGTFVPVYESAESLDAVVPATTVHAHNDYLEILLEGGIAAAVIVLAFFIVLGVALFRRARLRQPLETATHMVAAAAGLLILLSYSLVDYPLRMPALAASFAVFFASILPGRGRQSAARGLAVVGQGGTVLRTKLRRAACILMAVLTAGVALQSAVSMRLLQRQQYQAALAWAPWSARAYERQSTALFRQGAMAGALPDAFRTVRLSPVNAGAIRTIGLVRLGQGNSNQGGRLMSLALTLGWRDRLTQLWAMEAAFASREPAKAVQRAEALFRQDSGRAAALVMLLHGPPAARAHLVSQLAQKPSWRASVFRAAGELPAGDLQRFISVLEGLRGTPAPATPEEVGRFVARLVGADQLLLAQRAWRLGRARGLVANRDFETAGADGDLATALNWRIPRRVSGLVDVQTAPIAPGGRALRVAGAASSSAVVTQELMLPPGTYRLASRGYVATPTQPGIGWELRCRGSDVRSAGTNVLRRGENWQLTTLELTVPDQNCPIQTLALRVLNGSQKDELWIDEVSLAEVVR